MISYKKFIFTFFLTIFVFTGVVIPKSVNAFSPGVVAVNIGKKIWEQSEKIYDKVQGIVGAELSNRTVGMFLDSLAYDVANQLAEGGQGGKPLFRTISMKKSLETAGQQALGEFLGELTEKGFDDLGINLCNPSLELKLTLTLGLIDEEKPPKPKCEWTSLQNNWKRFGDDMQADLVKFQLDPRRSGSTSVNEYMKNIFSPDSTDLGAAFTLTTELNRRKLEAEKVHSLTIDECKGFISKKTTVSAEIITHCSQFENLAEGFVENAGVIDAMKQLEKKLAAENVTLASILKDAGNKFLDTFSSKLMNNWIKRGMWSLFGDTDNDVYQEYKDSLLDRLRGGANIRQPRGADIFKDFKTVNIESLESFDYLSTYAICPSSFRQPDNCVLNAAFLQAINSKMTIRQAIKDGIIDGDTPLVHPNDAINNTIDKCYRDNFCYTNLVKLRKANILPVGWELAALRAPVSLQQAIDCFEDDETETKCEFNKEDKYAVAGNAHNPFYHLIDPDWVLKIPDVRCDAYAYSAVLESPEASNRQQYCADPKVCLREDSDGNCLEDQFEYCTRSENIWNFEGEFCEAGELYAGCLVFSNENFGDNAYIEDSLEYCTADQVGCRRHSQDMNESNEWMLEDVAFDDNDLFLNAQTVECTSDNAGCNEYIVLAPDTGANIIPNSDFEVDVDVDNQADGFGGADNLVSGEGTNASNAVLAAFRSEPAYPAPNTHLLTCFSGFTTLPNTNYTLSVDVRLNPLEPGTGGARIAVNGCFDVNGADGGLTENETWMDTTNDFGRPLDIEANLVVPVSELSATEYTRISGTFNSGNSVHCASICVGSNYSVPYNPNNLLDDFPHYFDNLKVEAVTQPLVNTSYSAYGNGARIYTGSETVMCTADEVGCQGYIPENGDPMIPAVITQDDLCPAQCVGYETFTEQITSFDIIENDLLVDYYNFIPETAQECPDQEIGCEEFTNLDVVAEGGEGKEYFTYLRQCVEENRGKLYYTWEGTDVEGYQIKPWYALVQNIGEAPCTNMAPEGGACLDVGFIDDTIDTLNEEAVCGPDTSFDTFDDPNNNPNCRIFFDEGGNEYYRLQDRVIFATNNCHDYRRTLTGQIYRAVPDESITCAAANDGCRSYYGNTANNIRLVFADNFEDGTYEPWYNGGADLSNVSLNNNGHSLRVLTGQQFDRDLMDISLQGDKEYTVSWWMKSDVQMNDFSMILYAHDTSPRTSIDVIIDSSEDSNFQNIEANNWHYYTTSFHTSDLANINMALLDDLALRVLTDTSIDGQGLYIDNFTIKEIENSFSVVRNSWDTPIECNQPYDAYHLGCQSYRDLNGRDFNLKSFDHLCREDAIGCLPVIDTNNSTNPFEEVFNVGDYSEITVPADSLTYLVPNPDNYCPQTTKGCSKLGIQDRLDETNIFTVYKINDPDKYASIMCAFDSLNCEEYNTAKGSAYFKDPGARTCSYQENMLIQNTLLSGWFKTDTLVDEIPLGCGDTDGDYDTNGDSFFDVSELIFPNDYCSVSPADGRQLFYFTEEDCNDNSGYWNDYLLAAQCPSSENLCTSFRDPVDPLNCDPKGKNLSFIDFEGYCIDSNPMLAAKVDCEAADPDGWFYPSKDGYCDDIDYDNERACNLGGATWTAYCKNYYYYNDENIDEASCNGVVDRQDGCVLFYDANNWNGDHSQNIVTYDANETYENIEASNDSSGPVACNPSFDPSCNLDSNKLIKVTKDRQCAEWLACKSSAASKDPETGEYKIICDDLDTCIEFQNNGDSNATKCKEWGSYDTVFEALTFEKYQSRDTGLRSHMSWSDKEYLGYSVPDMLPVSGLVVNDFGDNDNPLIRLTYNVTDSIDANGRYFDDCYVPLDPGPPIVPESILDGEICNTTINTDGDYFFRGECHNRVCWVNPQINNVSTSTYGIETRAYSIADAPFPKAIEPDNLNRLSKYKGANVCDNDSNLCETSFSKVEYGNNQETLYYAEGSNDIPEGICTSGASEKIGQDCGGTYENSDCDSSDMDGSRRDGICSVRTKEIVFKNWPGICLEYDLNNPVTKDEDSAYYCNQWYPAQKIKGTASLYDNYKEAGYFEPNGRDVEFCTVAEPYLTTEERYYCAASISRSGVDYCSVLVHVPVDARVKIDLMNEHLDTIRYGYLDTENMLNYGRFEAVSSEGVNFSGLGVSWLKRAGAAALFTGNPSGNHTSPLGIEAGARPGNGSSLFFTKDFDPLKKLELDDFDILPVLPLVSLDDIFDTTDSGPVTMYYYDTKVDRNGNYSYRGGVVWPFGPLYYPLGLRQKYGVALTDDEVDQDLNQCDDGYHESWFNDFLDGDYSIAPGGWDQRGWDGDGHLERSRWCSPMSHGIYIRPVFPFDAPDMEICNEVDCRETEDCLDFAEPYQSISTIGPCAASDDACLYKKCVEDDLPATHAGIRWCSDYGDIESNTISISYDCSGFIPNKIRLFTDVSSISGCSEHIYETEITSIPVEYDGCTTGAGQTYNRLATKSTVNSALTAQVASCTPQPNPPPNVIEGADCHTESTPANWPWYDLSTGRHIYNRITIMIPSRTFHPDVSGSVCTELDCYQQCRVVTHLDSDGLLSAVRTDIWWRNKQEPQQRLIVPAWESWYIDNSANYEQYDDVLYGSIESESSIQGDYPDNFSHFGAAVGNFDGDSVVGTRVPFYKDSLVELSAATFFAHMVDDTDRDDALARANLHLGSLLYRAYNFDWQGGVHFYGYSGESILSNRNNTNIMAGPEYAPRILQVCGDQLCEELDIDGNIISVGEGITVNGENEGRLSGQGASLFVNLKLFFHAHPDHMPIYNVGVDWGDGPGNNFSRNPGKYKNSLPAEWCDSNLSAPGEPHNNPGDPKILGFAGTDDACQAGYKIFYHNYVYDRAFPCNGVPFGKPNEANASCYRPSIKVTDNWFYERTETFDGWIVVYNN